MTCIPFAFFLLFFFEPHFDVCFVVGRVVYCVCVFFFFKQDPKNKNGPQEIPDAILEYGQYLIAVVQIAKRPSQDQFHLGMHVFVCKVYILCFCIPKKFGGGSGGGEKCWGQRGAETSFCRWRERDDLLLILF